MVFAAGYALLISLISACIPTRLAMPVLAESQARLQRVQREMKVQGLAGMMLTRPANHEYFVGMHSEFWQSPTRSYLIIIPTVGNITAIVPSIASHFYKASPVVAQVYEMANMEITEADIAVVADELKKAAISSGNERFGAELGSEYALQMPVSDFLRIRDIASLSGHTFVDASTFLKPIFAIKSEVEVGSHARACAVQSQALERVPEFVYIGQTEREWCRRVRAEIFLAGADEVPYIACVSGAGGYDNIINSASERVLRPGDMMIIDVGSTINGHYCDFNRNFYVGTGEIPEHIASAQRSLFRAVDAGIQAAQVGATTADVFAAMNGELPANAGESVQEQAGETSQGSVGRFGHSIGFKITEWPSILPESANASVPLEAGMVFSLEPSMSLGWEDRVLVHEEVVVIRPKGPAELLSKRAPREIPRITQRGAQHLEEASCRQRSDPFFRQQF